MIIYNVVLLLEKKDEENNQVSFSQAYFLYKPPATHNSISKKKQMYNLLGPILTG